MSSHCQGQCGQDLFPDTLLSALRWNDNLSSTSASNECLQLLTSQAVVVYAHVFPFLECILFKDTDTYSPSFVPFVSAHATDYPLVTREPVTRYKSQLEEDSAHPSRECYWHKKTLMQRGRGCLGEGIDSQREAQVTGEGSWVRESVNKKKKKTNWYTCKKMLHQNTSLCMLFF